MKDGEGRYESSAEDVPPILEGLWPVQAVQLGTPGAFRGRKLVGIEVRPFQYDEAQGRLVVTGAMVVRVDFNRPAGASALPVTASSPDPHMDDVLAIAMVPTIAAQSDPEPGTPLHERVTSATPSSVPPSVPVPAPAVP